MLANVSIQLVPRLFGNVNKSSSAILSAFEASAECLCGYYY